VKKNGKLIVCPKPDCKEEYLPSKQNSTIRPAPKTTGCAILAVCPECGTECCFKRRSYDNEPQYS
jgi:hypothetical protein